MMHEKEQTTITPCDQETPSFATSFNNSLWLLLLYGYHKSDLLLES